MGSSLLRRDVENFHFISFKNCILSSLIDPSTHFMLDINGRFAMRMSKMQLKNTFYDVLDDKKAEKLFLALRAENDRIARIRVKRRMALQKEGAQF